MKTILIYILLIIMPVQISAQRYAMIVGVSHYPQNSGWKDIHSCNDVQLLKSTLGHDFSITTLEDGKATYRLIKEGFSRLTTKIKNGNTVLIHFSCHGQQMLATNDKNEPDGLDECLIPYDARKTKSQSYSGASHLKDNEISLLIKRLMQKAGPKGLVIVTIDACHSDSMNRGDDSLHIRGTEDIFGIESKAQAEQLRKIYRNPDSKEITKEANEADVIYLSACMSYQNNYETRHNGKFYGSLTLCLCQAYSETGISNIANTVAVISKKMRLISQFGQKMAVRSTIKLQ